MGLFGDDLTDFNEDCALATENCIVSNFSDYDGYAIAVYFESSPDNRLPSAANTLGVCFLRDYNCVYVVGNEPYTFNSFSMTHPAYLTMPN